VLAEHQHLVEQGAELVELRLDYISRVINLKRLLKDRPCPVIVTCRRVADGGKWAGSEEARQTLLRTAIAEGVEYVDLEEDVAGMIPRFGPTKRIVSRHDFSGTPAHLTEIHANLASLDADIVKLATMANSPLDNIRMLQMCSKSEIPTVGLCMGEMGTPSRILAGRFGAPFTFATFHHERTLAPGQLSFKQMQEIYHYDEIDKDYEVFGVIADPVGHSLSPIIHNEAFHSLGMKRVYVPFRVPEADLHRFLQHSRELGIRGLSVTIPHKEAAIARCNKVESVVRGIGAVNTMVFAKDGSVLGYNTDHRAAMESLFRVMGVDSDKPKPLDGVSALVLGAGGVSKAIAYGLGRKGATVAIASRTKARALALAKAVDGRAVDWDQRHRTRPEVLINGTPVGMHPNVDDTPWDEKYLQSGTIVFDTVYNPEQTLLVKQARQAGCRVITGVDMFIRQAGHQFHLFTGEDAPTDLMRETLKRAIGPAKY
jgi:3-dehydroquinate dehydratase/shikimate dehydrogenase